MAKWLSDDSATGKVMVQRKQHINSSCPRYDHPEEYTEHVLQCHSNDMCELRDNTILEMRMWMKSVHTQPDIEFFIFSGLISWLSNDLTVFNLDISIDPVILTAIRYQLCYTGMPFYTDLYLDIF